MSNLIETSLYTDFKVWAANALQEFITPYFPKVKVSMLWEGTEATLQMLSASWVLTTIFGIMLGVILYLTSPKQLMQNRVVYPILSIFTNILRSIPFLILIIYLLPYTKNIVGTSFGVKGAIVPLTIGAIPFFAKLVETALREVDRGIIEAAVSMGTPMHKIIFSILLREARPSLIAGATITGILLLSFTAMAGVVGAGGLGDLATRFGFHRNQPEITNFVIVIIIIIAQTIQLVGDTFMRRLTRK
ncbi:methionine ABC transporter permease [Wohlfahrtiimonas chitiniclastica]|uniref:methionine ABC transporter permease n=1 Tax=Wohlfahrtiimonas chitiniclastica TaxID=400946 RepID=UPI000B98BA90|nr:methionine ABC transporter permease [Wohlfahrtiimonas chitiniclastica]OYQ74735.1 metal ABC transporter permease [Wohlfahrtiimonas chitiniclastica]